MFYICSSNARCQAMYKYEKGLIVVFANQKTRKTKVGSLLCTSAVRGSVFNRQSLVRFQPQHQQLLDQIVQQQTLENLNLTNVKSYPRREGVEYLSGRRVSKVPNLNKIVRQYVITKMVCYPSSGWFYVTSSSLVLIAIVFSFYTLNQ